MDIVLTTLNARYAHCAFGLRYLLANLGPMRPRARIMEFEVSQAPVDVLEALLAQQPRIVGLGVYIWNADVATRLAAQLKRLRPDITLILGGPEVSHETDQQEIVRHADYVITGEADVTFARLCEQLLRGEHPPAKVIPGELPRMDEIELPYDLYTTEDIAHRVLYVEASRGCPFSCEFCLSSLDIPVRQVLLDKFLSALQGLLDRGARRFKFVDRTFNLNLNTSRTILKFFRERYTPGLFLHFEMIPDHLPPDLREAIQWFPPGALQFEVGIQTFNEEVAARISRRQDNAKVEENLRWLRAQTGVHVHADLIVGLPGEGLAGFAAGFDRLVSLGPQEIQVGLLKRLRGTPIARHDETWGMVYAPHAPYEVLRTSAIDFPALQRLRRFARYWDLIANSGNFVATTPLLWQVCETTPGSSGAAHPAAGSGVGAFATFMALSDWLFGQSGRTHGISLPRLTALLFEYLTGHAGRNADTIAQALAGDLLRTGQARTRRDMPAFLRPYLSHETAPVAPQRHLTRQDRHRM